MSSNDTRIRGHVTTEATSKRLKLQQIFAVLLLIVGFMWMFVGAQGPRVDGKPPAAMANGLFVTATGFAWYLGIRFFRWWNHG